MKVIVSTRARRELFGIAEWIERDNPERARTYIAEIYDARHALHEFAERYPPAAEFGAEIRKRSYGNYLILYRVREVVTIISIRHAAQARR